MKRYAISGIIAIFIIGLTYLGFAQNADNSNMGKPFKELRSEIHSYIKANAINDLKSWKAQLDAALSKEDLSTLNVLRSKAKALRLEKISDISQIRNDRKNNDEQDIEALKEKMKSLPSEMKDLEKELAPLMQKYKSDLEELAKAAKPKVEIWKDSIKSIIENWKKQFSEEMKQFKKHEDVLKNRMKSLNHFPFGNQKKLMEKFMLWDGGEDFLNNELLQPNSVENLNGTTSKGNLNIIVNPNPVSATGNIKFDLPKNEHVVIELYDSFADKIAVIYDGDMSQGSQSVDFNINNGSFKNISNGVYIIKLIAGEYSCSYKAMVKR
jgi:hypothetical protein